MGSASVEVVLIAAKALLAWVDDNRAVRRDAQEMMNTIELVVQSVSELTPKQGSHYATLLQALNNCIGQSRDVLADLADRKKKFLRPRTQLDMLTALRREMDGLVQKLGAALSAEAVTKLEAQFDASDLIEHSSARRFWTRNFGSNTYQVSWQRFQKAYNHQMSQVQANMPELNSEALSLLLYVLDSDLDGNVDVYEFNSVTRERGLMGAVLAVQQAHSQGKVLNAENGAVEEEGLVSSLSHEEELERTLLLENVLVNCLIGDTLCKVRQRADAIGNIVRMVAATDRLGTLVQYEDPIDTALVAANFAQMEMEQGVRVRPLFPSPYTIQDAQGLHRERQGKGGADATTHVLQLLTSKEAQAAHEEVYQQKMAEVQEELQRALEQGSGEQRPVISQFKAKMVALTEEFERAQKEYEEHQQTLESELGSDAAWRCALVVEDVADSQLRELISLPESDQFRHAFACCLRLPTRTLKGTLFVTQTTLVFYSRPAFSSPFAKTIPMDLVTSVSDEVSKTLKIRVGLRLVTAREVIVLESFPRLNEAVALINGLWRETSGCAMDRSKAILEGRLMKQGQVRHNWKYRWFVLTDKWLAYFADKEDKHPIREIAVEQLLRVERVDPLRSGFGIVLRTVDRKLPLVSYSRDEADEWFAKLKGVIESNTSVQRIFFQVIKRNERNLLQPRTLMLDFTALKLRSLQGGKVRREFSFTDIEVVEDMDLSGCLRVIFHSKNQPYQLYASNEWEAAKMSLVLKGIAEHGNNFKIPDNLRECLGVSISGVVGEVCGYRTYRRWVEVTNYGYLLTFKSEGAAQPMSVLSLHGLTLVPEGYDQLAIFKQGESSPTHTLRMRSKGFRDEWFQAMRHVSRPWLSVVDRAISLQEPSEGEDEDGAEKGKTGQRNVGWMDSPRNSSVAPLPYAAQYAGLERSSMLLGDARLEPDRPGGSQQGSLRVERSRVAAVELEDLCEGDEGREGDEEEQEEAEGRGKGGAGGGEEGEEGEEEDNDDEEQKKQKPRGEGNNKPNDLAISRARAVSISPAERQAARQFLAEERQLVMFRSGYRKKPKARAFRLGAAGSALEWYKLKNPSEVFRIPLADIKAVRLGDAAPQFRNKSSFSPDLSFSVITKGGDRLDLVADTPRLRDEWARALCQCAGLSPEIVEP